VDEMSSTYDKKGRREMHIEYWWDSQKERATGKTKA
jgi:hypothetical protein